jgi:hypothetical protein
MVALRDEVKVKKKVKVEVKDKARMKRTERVKEKEMIATVRVKATRVKRIKAADGEAVKPKHPILKLSRSYWEIWRNKSLSINSLQSVADVVHLSSSR